MGDLVQQRHCILAEPGNTPGVLFRIAFFMAEKDGEVLEHMVCEMLFLNE